MATPEALDRLRDAILADVSEDMGLVDELTDEHNELVAAWNAAFPENTIEDADIEEMYE